MNPDHGSSIRPEVLPLFDLNRSVQPEDAARLTAQAKKIYELFKRVGRVSTGELSSIALQYNARIYELRRWLEIYKGKTIKLVKKGKGGNNFYEIV